MTAASLMQDLQEFSEFVQFNEPLAPYTYLKLGGPAEALVQPRTVEELCAVVRRCAEKRIPMRLLGGGCNVLVRDEGVPGVVLRLNHPVFTQVTVEERRVRAGAGCALSALISQAARHGLGGFEGLVGTPGTVGGALRNHTADGTGDIAQFLCWVEVVDSTAKVQMREREDLAATGGVLDDPVVLAAEFELETESTDTIVKHMRKAYIQRKRTQPFSFQAACRVFKNPRGLGAAALITQAGLGSARVGGAEVSDRDANYIVANAGTSSRDVLRLIDLIRTRVQEHFNTELELELRIW